MISKGKDVRGFFPDVVKNVASTSFEVRKLVYIYLLRYAEEEPDLSLLSINTFQKDLTDRNPMIRAMALRVMSSIRVQMIAPLIMMALKTGSRDMSPHVRKAAANALPKIYSLDPGMQEDSMELLELFMNDASTLVLGSAILTMNAICPDRFDLIHRHFRKLCSLLIDADEWAQIEIVGVLVRYARTFFTDPNVAAVAAAQPNNGSADAAEQDFYSKKQHQDSATIVSALADLDPDHALLIHSCIPLLQSRNAAVVLAASRLLIHTAPTPLLNKPISSLLRLLTLTSTEHQYYILQNLLTLAHTHPTLLHPHTRHFYVFHDDSVYIKDLKLEILGVVAWEGNALGIVKELKDLVRSWDSGVAVKAVKLMGIICGKIGNGGGGDDGVGGGVAAECLACLMGLLASDQEIIVAESVIVTRRLLQQTSKLTTTSASGTATGTNKNTRLIILLARSLDAITIPMARASILWLIGQHCEAVPKIAHDSFRTAVKGFCGESLIVKLQILTLGAKLVSVIRDTNSGDEKEKKANATVLLIWEHVLNLARYDASFDVRDRARLLKGLVEADQAAEGVVEKGLFTGKLKSVLLTPKAVPAMDIAQRGQSKFTLGSLSHSFNIAVKGYKPLPDWSPVVKCKLERNITIAQATAWSEPVVRSVSSTASMKGPHGGSQSIPPRRSSNQLAQPSVAAKAAVQAPTRSKFDDLAAFLDESSSDEEGEVEVEVEVEEDEEEQVEYEYEEEEDEEEEYEEEEEEEEHET
ncbi:adaptin N terminal region-domain-containing protein [Obelidium mucronatum]|nr:adaptin N terminal region-domain-containing protein [Obelidium mucronatum]